MQSASKGNQTYSYTYNSDGLRIGKTNGTTTYTYTWNDGKLTSQTWGNSYMLFYYNAEGKPLYVEYHDANDECSGTYYYVLNLQGDTVALYDPARNITAVNYEYDAWGREISWSTYDSGYAGLIFNNPLTYRGYIYDRETGFYYLQSRYYDPTIGRFLNADDVLYLGSTGSLISYTLFAYCDNNCVCSLDYDGHEKMAIFYDNRPSGLFGWILKGFRIQAQHWIEYFESRTQLSVFPFTSIDEFVKKWNLSDRKYDTVIIISHGFPGGLSCNGKNLVHVTNGYEKNSVFSYKLTSKSVKFLYLFCCNGATENASKMSIAKDLAFRTSALVFAVQNGKISIDLFSGAVTKAGGFWVRISYLGRGRNGDLWSIKEYLTLKSFSPSTI